MYCEIKIVQKIFKPNELRIKISPLYNYLKLLKLDKNHDLEVTNFMYEIKVRSLPNAFTNYFRSIATIHYYNTRQAANNTVSKPATVTFELHQSFHRTEWRKRAMPVLLMNLAFNIICKLIIRYSLCDASLL